MKLMAESRASSPLMTRTTAIVLLAVAIVAMVWCIYGAGLQVRYADGVTIRGAESARDRVAEHLKELGQSNSIERSTDESIALSFDEWSALMNYPRAMERRIEFESKQRFLLSVGFGSLIVFTAAIAVIGLMRSGPARESRPTEPQPNPEALPTAKN
jgi:hypothetical protein